jgi:hypothetical protein
MTYCGLVITHQDQNGNSRRIHCHVDLVVGRVGEDVKDAPDLVRLQQEKMERRAVLLANSGVQLVTLAVSLTLHWASHSQRNQAIVQATNCAASIERLMARVSQQMKGCSQPREAKKTGKLYPLQRAESRRVTIRQAESLHLQQGGEGVVASTSWALALVLVVKLAMRKPSFCVRLVHAIPSPCRKRSKLGALPVTRAQAQAEKDVCGWQCHEDGWSHPVDLPPRSGVAIAETLCAVGEFSCPS